MSSPLHPRNIERDQIRKNGTRTGRLDHLIHHSTPTSRGRTENTPVSHGSTLFKHVEIPTRTSSLNQKHKVIKRRGRPRKSVVDQFEKHGNESQASKSSPELAYPTTTSTWMAVQASKAAGHQWTYYFEPSDKLVHFAETGLPVPDEHYLNHDAPFFVEIDDLVPNGGSRASGASKSKACDAKKAQARASKVAGRA